VNELCEIVFYHHSGFTAALKDTLVVFDYWEGHGETLAPAKRLTTERMKAYTYVYVFTSHAHPDHMDPVIYTWDRDPPVIYVTAADVPVGTRGRRMAPGDEMPLHDGVYARAFQSTDSGVSFLVDLYGCRVFHAGDLNLWHWRQESTFREIAVSEKAFEEAIGPIADHKIDIALFPVDPRQGALYDAGAIQFILSVKPKLLIPMHWQGRADVATDFARRMTDKTTTVYALTKPRERLTYLLMPDGIPKIDVYYQEPARPKPPETAAADPLDPIDDTMDDGRNPFTQSDMPVDIHMDEEGEA